MLQKNPKRITGYIPDGGYRHYSNENTETAKKLIEKGTNILKASRQTGVPETTLRDRVSGRIGWSISKSGPQPLLGVDGEKLLVETLTTNCLYGYG